MGQVIKLKKHGDDFNLEISKLTNLCQEDLKSINTLILEKLDSNVPLIHEIASYLIMSGGKRLRPLLTSCCFHLIVDKIKDEKNYIGLAICKENKVLNSFNR